MRASARHDERPKDEQAPGKGLLPPRHEVCKAHAGQAGEEHVAVETASDYTDEEGVDHGPGLIRTPERRRRIDEVGDVLDHGKTDADHGAIHEPVHDAVELGRDDQEEDDDAGQLEYFFCDRSDHRGAPIGREVGGSDLAQD